MTSVGRIDLEELDLGDADAGAVLVERLLDKLLDVGLGDLARLGEQRLDVRAADDLAHGAFGDGLHRAVAGLPC